MKEKSSEQTVIYNSPKTSSEERDLELEKKLISLYALQKVDSKIDSIRTLRGELPLEVQDLEDDISGYNAKIEKLEAEIEELNTNVSDRKSSITDLKAQIKKYEKQLKEVKNNREYDALTKELDYQSLEIQLHERRIREAANHLEHKQEELEKAKFQKEERTKDLESKKAELDEIVAETEKEEKELIEKSEKIKAGIEPRWLKTYLRIRENAHNGLAVVRIERDACGGCFSKIPAQRQIEIRLHKKLIACEYCGRFLVDDSICEQVDNSEE